MSTPDPNHSRAEALVASVRMTGEGVAGPDCYSAEPTQALRNFDGHGVSFDYPASWHVSGAYQRLGGDGRAV